MTDHYFAYGSNLLDSEIRRHARDAKPVGVAFLAGHRLVFTKHSRSWGGDAATIETSPSAVVWGYLYRLNDRDRQGLRKREKGYTEKEVTVEQVRSADGTTTAVTAVTFIGEAACPRRCGPSARYLSVVVEGARSRGLPMEYIEEIVAGGREGR